MARHALNPEVRYEPPSDILPTTLGSSILSQHVSAEKLGAIAEAETLPIARAAALAVAEQYEHNVATEIDNLRTDLASLEGRNRTIINDYLKSRMDVMTSIEHTDLVGWFATPSELGGASSETLLHFLKEHQNEVAHQQQGPETRHTIEQHKEDFLGLQTEAVEEGWLHPHSMEAGEKIKAVKVYIGDVWDTILNDIGGYFTREGTLVVAQAAPSDEQVRRKHLRHYLESSAAHEYEHLQFSDEVALPRVMDEALAELVRLGCRKPDAPLVVEAGMRQKANLPEDTVYWRERRWLNLLLTGGLDKIEPEAATLMFTSGGKDTLEYKAFFARLDKSWGTTDKVGQSAQRLVELEAGIRNEDAQRVRQKQRAGEPVTPKTRLDIEAEALDIVIQEIEADIKAMRRQRNQHTQRIEGQNS